MTYRTYVCTVPYVEEAIEAEKRLKRGKRQKRCPVCRLWFWPERVGIHGCEDAS